jgi:hypothetical protein
MLPAMACAWLYACVRLKRTLHLLANTYYMQFINMATLCVPSLTVVVCRMLLLVLDYTGAPGHSGRKQQDNKAQTNTAPNMKKQLTRAWIFWPR